MSFGKSKGAQTSAVADQQATAELRRQFNQTRSDLLPFIEAGARQLPSLEAGATLGGLDEVLGQIFGSENFQNLRNERTSAVQGQLAAGGLTRSGTALQEAAAQGKGAAALDGRLIDAASARMANNVVEVAESIAVKNGR